MRGFGCGVIALVMITWAMLVHGRELKADAARELE